MKTITTLENKPLAQDPRKKGNAQREDDIEYFFKIKGFSQDKKSDDKDDDDKKDDDDEENEEEDGDFGSSHNKPEYEH